jgi:hypothetical protein
MTSWMTLVRQSPTGRAQYSGVLLAAHPTDLRTLGVLILLVPNGVQGVAGSNPAVPIKHDNDLRPPPFGAVFVCPTPVAHAGFSPTGHADGLWNDGSTGRNHSPPLGPASHDKQYSREDALALFPNLLG